MTEQNGSDVFKDTLPQALPEESGGVKVPVKFNKQIKMLDIDEAAVLAQKGMKFDVISADFERVRKLASMQGKSIGEFVGALEEAAAKSRRDELIKKCGGDEALAQHIADLEDSAADTKLGGERELYEQFPEIKNIKSLPQEVLTAAKLRGSSLLDEYLRYRRRAELKAEREMQSKTAAEVSSIGSQSASVAPDNPERSEFIKALWGN